MVAGTAHVNDCLNRWGNKSCGAAADERLEAALFQSLRIGKPISRPGPTAEESRSEAEEGELGIAAHELPGGSRSQNVTLKRRGGR